MFDHNFIDTSVKILQFQLNVAWMFCAELVQPSLFVNLVLAHMKQRDTSVRQ